MNKLLSMELKRAAKSPILWLGVIAVIAVNVNEILLTGYGFKTFTTTFLLEIVPLICVIAKDGEVLVFCEVKYRSDTRKGEPAEAVGIKKQQTIYKCAAAYLQEYGIGEMPCRFDVISILGREICLIQDAF